MKQYTADWKVIEALLDLPSLELKVIEAGWSTIDHQYQMVQ